MFSCKSFWGSEEERATARAPGSGTISVEDDLLLPGSRHRLYLCFSNKGFGMGQASFLIKQAHGQASSGIGCPPTLTMLLDASLHIFCYPRVERPIPATEDVDSPIICPLCLHPTDHSQIFRLHILLHSGLDLRYRQSQSLSV
jgi:hypothetical protein